MKNLFFIFLLSISCTLTFGQTTMDIQNNRSCDVYVDFYEDIGGCVTSQTSFLVPANSIHTASSAGGGLFIDAIFTDPASGYQYGSTNGVSAPTSACATTCPVSFASSAVLLESGPAGTSCARSITPTWVPGCPIGTSHGIIEIN
ncbi:MAG: hypothetical protein RJQ00_03385 [Vicingaceae bacterium]